MNDGPSRLADVGISALAGETEPESPLLMTAGPSKGRLRQT
jgi:hypothetical protein